MGGRVRAAGDADELAVPIEEDLDVSVKDFDAADGLAQGDDEAAMAAVVGEAVPGTSDDGATNLIGAAVTGEVMPGRLNGCGGDGGRVPRDRSQQRGGAAARVAGEDDETGSRGAIGGGLQGGWASGGGGPGVKMGPVGGGGVSREETEERRGEDDEGDFHAGNLSQRRSGSPSFAIQRTQPETHVKLTRTTPDANAVRAG